MHCLGRSSPQAKRVDEVRKASEVYTSQLKERIDKKIEEKSEKRDAQLQAIRDRIKEHVRMPAQPCRHDDAHSQHVLITDYHQIRYLRYDQLIMSN